MTGTMKSLAQSRWECQSPVVCIPTSRRKAIDGEVRQLVGEIGHDWARQKAGRSGEGHLLPDPVHRCIEGPPKPAVASGIGLLQGKSALARARRVQEQERNCTGEHGWARGYAVSTVGFALESVKTYIRAQETADQEGRFSRSL
jgi:putative transposase